MNPDVVWDGIFGALIGSGVTATAVVATIRHDARQRRLDRLDDTIGAAHGATQAWFYAVNARGPLHHTSEELMPPALQATTTLTARARGLEPGLAALVMVASEDVAARMEQVQDGDEEAPELAASIQRLFTTIGCWLSEPDNIRKGKLDYASVTERVTTAALPPSKPADP